MAAKLTLFLKEGETEDKIAFIATTPVFNRSCFFVVPISQKFNIKSNKYMLQYTYKGNSNRRCEMAKKNKDAVVVLMEILKRK